jgi:hypothetical protein
MDIHERLENTRRAGMGAIQSTLHAMVYEKERNFNSSAKPMNSFTSTGTYAPDMYRRMCLVKEPTSGSIRGNYFLPAT